MFAGIVEQTGAVIASKEDGNLLRLSVARPASFVDIEPGNSICLNGVCLTLEDVHATSMHFAVGPETLRVTGWTRSQVLGMIVNLERSLRVEDRIHGHFVTGHVDATGRVMQSALTGPTQQLTVEFPAALRPFIWSKGSIALQGVSLTVNEVVDNRFTVGLIPETLRRTNLMILRANDQVNLEVDNMARGFVHWARLQQESR